MLIQMRLALMDSGRALGLWRGWLYLAWHDVTARYRRSILGPFWIALGMLAASLALSISWGAISGQAIHDYVPYVMAGLLVWTHFVGIFFTEAPELFVAAQASIRSTAFPFMFYVFRSVARSLIVCAHTLVAFLMVTALLGNLKVPSWQILPGLLVSSLVVVALAPVIGMASARYRDLRLMLPFAAQILFFATPVFWHADTLTGPGAAFVHYNPFYYLLEVVRAPLLGHAASGRVWMVVMSILAVSILVWFVSFSAARRRIAFWI
jgi:ABC-type polysaccharide/polyol phosphate export permease